MKNLRIRLREFVIKKSSSGKSFNVSKTVYVKDGEKLIGQYDSITKCGLALGLSRPAVKKAIESGMLLDNGLKLTFNK
jgi:hypothetical protein